MNQRLRLRGFNFALKCLVIPVLVFFILIAIPVLGNFLVIGGAELLGCSIAENEPHPCHFMEWDISELVGGYTLDAFIGGAANPLIACFAFVAFIRSFMGVIWLLAISGVFVAREVKRRQLIVTNNSVDGEE